MTYTKIPGEWLTDSRLLPLSDRAWRLYVMALIYSNHHELDGRVPDPALRILIQSPRAAVDELVRAKLWERGIGAESGSWVIRDFFEHQLSADELRKLREARRKAALTRWDRTKLAYETKHVDSTSYANASHEQSNGDAPSRAGEIPVPLPSPSPSPVPKEVRPSVDGGDHARRAGLRQIGAATDRAASGARREATR